MNQGFWNERPIRIAIVGSGPSGLYTAEALVKSEYEFSIDIFEQFPTPYGLVRFGVAPDHPNIKKVTDKLDNILRLRGVSYYGNVTVGQDLSVEELRLHYDAVVFACGALEPRRLNIPGDELTGSHTAIEFVGWLNGHPRYRNARFDLSRNTAVVIGNGNVALDLARMLGKHAEELKNTDISESALKILSQSQIRRICIIGRRGPVQAAFSYKELKEIETLNSCYTHVESQDVTLDQTSEKELQFPGSNQKRRIYELFCQMTNNSKPIANKPRRIEFKFFRSPVSIHGSEHVEKLICEKNRLTGLPGAQISHGTGEIEEIECGLIFCSIGYRGEPIEGVPYEEKQGIFTNRNGRISMNGTGNTGYYAVGWIQRGPTGLIGNSRRDAAEVARTILTDLRTLAPCGIPDSNAIRDLLTGRQVRIVDLNGWDKIDRVERDHGNVKGKPREKFSSVQEMMSVL